MIDIENKTNFKAVELDNIPPIHQRNTTYDEVINTSVNATKDTICVQFENKIAKQIYSGLHGRILEYNQKPERKWDLLLAQRKDQTYIKRLPKESISQKNTK
jgi:hypothetical protein